MKRTLPFIIVAAVALLTAGAGTYFYTIKRAANPPLLMAKAGNSAAGEIVHALGPENAPVTLEEFGDFQCPPCGKISEPLNALQKKHNIRLIYRNFPLPNHVHAKTAAHAAEAAARQGKFWPMHDLLFREQLVWSKVEDARPLFQAYAGMLQLDLDRFRSDMDSAEVQRKVENDKRRGESIGVKNTPTIFLNNQALPANELDPDHLATFVETAVKNAKPSS